MLLQSYSIKITYWNHMVLLIDTIWNNISFHPKPWTIIDFYVFILWTQNTVYILII